MIAPEIQEAEVHTAAKEIESSEFLSANNPGWIRAKNALQEIGDSDTEYQNKLQCIIFDAVSAVFVKNIELIKAYDGYLTNDTNEVVNSKKTRNFIRGNRDFFESIHPDTEDTMQREFAEAVLSVAKKSI
jgi:hypothetical protein